MKQATRKLDWRAVSVAVIAGAGVMTLAAQLLAKPATPPVARAAARARAENVAPHPAPPPLGLRPGGLIPEGAPSVTPVRNLFRPLVAPTAGPVAASPASPAPALPAAPPPVTPPASPTVPSAPVPEAPEARIEMLGVIELGNRVQALLKHPTSGQSRYFAVGEDAFGYSVKEIHAESVTLERSGRTDRIAMSSAVAVEGPGSVTNAASTGSSGSSERGGFSRESGRFGRESRGDRERGRDSGRDGGGASTAQIMSLPTWTERLKKLEELKAQLEPERYERLKKFMAERAAQEKTR